MDDILVENDNRNNNTNVEENDHGEEIIEDEDNEDERHLNDDELDNIIEEIEEELDDLREEGEELFTGVRRSNRNRQPVERYTYHQKIDEEKIQLFTAEQKHNLFNQVKDKNEVVYDKYDGLVLARLIEDFDTRHRNEKVFAQQYILQKGLKIFGNTGEEAALK